MYEYVPKEAPKAADLGPFAQFTDLSIESTRSRWVDASKQAEVASRMVLHVGSNRATAIEIDGDLHVKGNFDLTDHRICALRVKGSLLVDGYYYDSGCDEPTFVMIEGDLVAGDIITGAELEVHGNVKTDHLIGNRNDYCARFFGSTTANTFYPETHSFQFMGDSDIALKLGIGVPSSSDAAFYATAFIGAEFVSPMGNTNDSAILEAIPTGKTLSIANPRDPLSAKTLNLSECELEELPEKLFDFANLECLNLDYNELAALQGLERLTKLRSLSLEGYDNDLPESLLQLPIDTLSLTVSTLPTWLGQMTHLKTLRVAMEEWDAIPEVLTELSSLKRLEVSCMPYKTSGTLLTDLARKLDDELGLDELSIEDRWMPGLPKDLSPFSALNLLELGLPKASDAERERIVKGLPSVDVRFLGD